MNQPPRPAYSTPPLPDKPQPVPSGVRQMSAAYWKAKFEEERHHSRQWEKRAKQNHADLLNAREQVEKLKTTVRTLL